MPFALLLLRIFFFNQSAQLDCAILIRNTFRFQTTVYHLSYGANTPNLRELAVLTCALGTALWTQAVALST